MKWKRGIGVFNGYIGRAYSDKGNYDSCRHYFLKAIAIYKTLDDTWNLASTTNNLGGGRGRIFALITRLLLVIISRG